MDKNIVLAKSRVENKNKDMYEQEVINQAGGISIIVTSILAEIFCLIQIFVDGSMNHGVMAIILSSLMTLSWVKYIKLRRKFELVMAIYYTIFVSVVSGFHIYHLITSSTIS